MFETILWKLVPTKTITKLSIQKNRKTQFLWKIWNHWSVSNKSIWRSNNSLFLFSHKKIWCIRYEEVNLAWPFHVVPKNYVHYNNCPLWNCPQYSGFSMRVWQCFCGCHEKVSVILGVSSIDRFYCIIIISISSAPLGSSTPSGFNLFPSASFPYKRKAKKRPWNNSNTWLNIAEIEDIFLRIN